MTLGSAPRILQVLTVDHSCMFFPMNPFQAKTFYSFGNHAYFIIFPCLGIHRYNTYLGLFFLRHLLKVKLAKFVLTCTSTCSLMLNRPLHPLSLPDFGCDPCLLRGCWVCCLKVDMWIRKELLIVIWGVSFTSCCRITQVTITGHCFIDWQLNKIVSPLWIGIRVGDTSVLVYLSIAHWTEFWPVECDQGTID